MKKDILIVNDSKYEMNYFISGFRQVPDIFNSVYAESAEKAMSILRRVHIDLLFAQYSLPKSGALLLLSAIRGYRRYNNLRVYLYGDHITEEQSKMARRLGASGCMEKTNDNAALVRQLKALLDPELLPAYAFFGNNESTRFMVIEEKDLHDHSAKP